MALQKIRRIIREKSEEKPAPEITKDGEVIFHKSQSSCSIKRDGKDSVIFEVKVYSDSPSDAVSKAISQFEILKRNFKEKG